MRLLFVLVVIGLLGAIPGVTPVSWQYLPNAALIVAAAASLKSRRGGALWLAILVGLVAGLCNADPIAFQPFLCLVAVLLGQLFWSKGRGRVPLLQVLSVVFCVIFIEWVWRSMEWGGVVPVAFPSHQALHASITLLFCPFAVIFSEVSD